MGERCTIGTNNENGTEGFVYLHWNSTPEEVTALTDYCAIQGYRSPCQDPWYGIARLCQTACNTWGWSDNDWMENGLSVGITTARCEEDYGHYVVDKGWFVEDRDGSGRWCYRDVEWRHPDEDKIWTVIKEINDCQPEHVHIDEDELYHLYRQRAERRLCYLRGDMEGAYKPVSKGRRSE